jgi:hypothetical protein
MNQPDDDQAQVPVATAAPTEVVSSPTATATAATPAPTLVATGGEEVTLTLEATEHVLVRVERGVGVLFEEMMTPGQTETWSDDEVLVVKTGNGAGLQVTVNGQAQGAMCGRGESCTRAWGPAGEIAPP